MGLGTVLLCAAALAAPARADSDRALYSDPGRGLELELGTFASGAGGLLGESRYFGVRKYGGGSGRWFDWGYDSRANALDLEARYGPDSLYERESLLLGSALAHVGRAYNLFGPVDVGWSVMGVMRLSGLFPNVALDETLGARWRLGDRHAMGFFTGLTQNAVQAGRTWTETLSEERTSTHEAVRLWGTMKGGLGYRIEAGRSENPLTDVKTLESALEIPRSGDPVILRARVETHDGESLEFARRRRSMGGEFALSRSWDMGVSLGVDEVDFGGVESRSRSLMLSFRYRERRSERSLLFESLRERRAIEAPAAGELPLARSLYEALRELDESLARLHDELAGLDPADAAARLAAAIERLPPPVREALAEELGSVDAADLEPLLERARAGTAEARGELARLAARVGDQALLERLAVRAARKELYAAAAETEFEILGRSVRLAPPQLIALAHAYGLGGSPLPPVTTRDVDQWLRRSCGGALKDCLLSRLPAEARSAAEAAWSDQALLDQSVRWAADLARREMNRMLLGVMLSAERLERLAVGGGRRPGELNRAAVAGSFEALDRRRAPRREVFAGARRRAEREEEG